MFSTQQARTRMWFSLKECSFIQHLTQNWKRCANANGNNNLSIFETPEVMLNIYLFIFYWKIHSLSVFHSVFFVFRIHHRWMKYYYLHSNLNCSSEFMCLFCELGIREFIVLLCRGKSSKRDSVAPSLYNIW